MDSDCPAEWEALPIQVTPANVVSIKLTPEEVAEIHAYGNRMFEKTAVDMRASQFPITKGKNKPNPNTIGIKGEYAGLKYFCPETTLTEFLNDRPWKMADMGDAVIVHEKPQIFDYKTRTRRVPVPELLDDDKYLAEMDIKFNHEKYAYLQAFVFCVSDDTIDTIHLMGWITAQDFFRNAQVVPAGTSIRSHTRPYFNNCLMLPYRRLHPIAKLKQMQYLPISEEITIQMREDWNLLGASGFNVEKYIKNL